MKAWRVLAVVLTSLALTGCMSREKPLQASAGASRPAQEDPADERRAIVAQLLEAHHETVGQMRVSSAIRPHQPADCN